jgi:putative membrane protein
MREFLVRSLACAVALWVVDGLWGSLWVTPHGGSAWSTVVAYAAVGVLVTLVNLIVKPVARVVALPAYILTLGLFSLIVNAALLELVSWVTKGAPIGLHVENFPTAIGAALVLAALTALIAVPFNRRGGRPRRALTGR